MFVELVRKRRSVREYKSDPVPREMLESCVEAARYAPTACNTQCCRFFIVEGDLKNRIVQECLGEPPVPNRWALQAPVIVVLATARNLVTHRLAAGLKGIRYDLVDSGIAGEHFVLQAVELGLGTCWLGWFKKKRLKKLLDIPAGWDVPAMITVGFPLNEPGDKDIKPVDGAVEYRR
ncbi:MAG: nitroreductase family protein [Candidatus Krumholzibacteriota bacterium]|nr:nitroreductase family protein [Candidatus Krumholzibacteriota bacterium]